MGRIEEWLISFFVILSWTAITGHPGYWLAWIGLASAPLVFGAPVLFEAAGWAGGLLLRSHWVRAPHKQLPITLSNALSRRPSHLLDQALCAELSLYYSKHKELAAKQFIQNLLSDNGYTTEFESVKEKIGSILQNEVIDFSWGQFCIVYVVDDHSAYMLKDRIDRPGGGIHLEDYRRMYKTVMNAFVLSSTRPTTVTVLNMERRTPKQADRHPSRHGPSDRGGLDGRTRQIFRDLSKGKGAMLSPEGNFSFFLFNDLIGSGVYSDVIVLPGLTPPADTTGGGRHRQHHRPGDVKNPKNDTGPGGIPPGPVSSNYSHDFRRALHFGRDYSA